VFGGVGGGGGGGGGGWGGWEGRFPMGGTCEKTDFKFLERSSGSGHGKRENVEGTPRRGKYENS